MCLILTNIYCIYIFMIEEEEERRRRRRSGKGE